MYSSIFVRCPLDYSSPFDFGALIEYLTCCMHPLMVMVIMSVEFSKTSLRNYFFPSFVSFLGLRIVWLSRFVRRARSAAASDWFCTVKRRERSFWFLELHVSVWCCEAVCPVFVYELVGSFSVVGLFCYPFRVDVVV